MKWTYGKAMLEQEDIKSLDEWNDDYEMAFSIMDDFDYLWQIQDGKYIFTDRQYADGNIDSVVENRIDAGVAVLTFNKIEDVFKYIKTNSDPDAPYMGWINRRLNKDLMRYIPKEFKNLVVDIYLDKERTYDEVTGGTAYNLNVEWENGETSTYTSKTMAREILKQFAMPYDFAK